MSRMIIHLNSVGKRYDIQWIFRDLSASFETGVTYAIKGRNGSGKSTLLRMISAMESPDLGDRIYEFNGKELEEAAIQSHLSFAAPYMGLPDYLTVRELIVFHGKFKQMSFSVDEMLEEIQLVAKANTPFTQLSSGQKQKVKLALCIHNSDPILLLDEPGTNLDEDNYSWFKERLIACKHEKLICIATNESRDLDLCDRELKLSMNG